MPWLRLGSGGQLVIPERLDIPTIGLKIVDTTTVAGVRALQAMDEECEAAAPRGCEDGSRPDQWQAEDG